MLKTIKLLLIVLLSDFPPKCKCTRKNLPGYSKSKVDTCPYCFESITLYFFSPV